MEAVVVVQATSKGPLMASFPPTWRAKAALPPNAFFSEAVAATLAGAGAGRDHYVPEVVVAGCVLDVFCHTHSFPQRLAQESWGLG